MARDARFYLLNCIECDDILRLDEAIQRPCMCGKTTAAFDARGKILTAGRARILTISYEDYDSAAPGEAKKWQIVKDPA